MKHSPEQEQPESISQINELASRYNDELQGRALGTERDAYGYAACDRLDVKWSQAGMMGRSCMMNGMAVYPEITVTTDTVDDGVTTGEQQVRKITVAKGLVAIEGVSHGFYYLQLFPNEPPIIAHKLVLEQENTFQHPVYETINKLSAYFSTTNLSVIRLDMIDPAEYLEPGDDIDDLELELAEGELPAPIPNIADDLSARSDTFVRLVNSTRFRRISRKKQVAIIDRYIEEAEQASGVRQSAVKLTPQYALIAQPEKSRDAAIEYQPVVLSDLVVQGTCVALTMLGRDRLQRRGIRRDSDLAIRRGGLALSVEIGELYQAQNDTILTPGDIIHVPISGQNFEILFG